MAMNITVQVDFHSTIQSVFGQKSTGITLSHPLTVRNLLDVLCISRERRERIFDDSGQLRSDLAIFINGRNIHFLGGIDTVLNNGDKMAIFPPVTGG
jgi:molybdopterin synthase sulfur carrier subunit